MALTVKRKKFCLAYVETGNASEAYRQAFNAKKMKPETVAKRASELMADGEVTGRIAELMKPAVDKAQATAEDILLELKHIGFANMLDYVAVQGDGSAYVDLSALTREQAAAISEISVDEYKVGRGEDARDVKRVKVKLIDKTNALDKLARVLSLYNDKLNLQIDARDKGDIVESILARVGKLKDAGVDVTPLIPDATRH